MTTDAVLRVLVLEDGLGDQAIIVAALRRGIEEHGASVGLFRFEWNGVRSLAEAEDALARIRFHVVLADLDLPDSPDVNETLQRVRQAAPHTPIIAVTGHDSVRTAGEASLAGADDFLAKQDVRPDRLMRAIIATVWRKPLE